MPPDSALVALNDTQLLQRDEVAHLLLHLAGRLIGAATALDVAMTVQRLIAAADLSERPRPSVRKGTSRIPPPSPRATPRAPATAPAAPIARATGTVSITPTAVPADRACY